MCRRGEFRAGCELFSGGGLCGALREPWRPGVRGLGGRLVEEFLAGGGGHSMQLEWGWHAAPGLVSTSPGS